MSSRCCSRASCSAPAVATLTYIYATSTAVVGPLALVAEPHTYDLCEAHARSLTAPRGWELVRHDGEFTLPSQGVADDLVALVEAVRERSPRPPGPAGTDPGADPRPDPGRGPHPEPHPDSGPDRHPDSGPDSGPDPGEGSRRGPRPRPGPERGRRDRQHLRVVPPG